MKSKVYYTRTPASLDHAAAKKRFAALIEESKVLDCAAGGDKVAVKMHFGEEGNTGYVKPEFVRIVCDSLSKKGSTCFLSDTNTLYRGRRTNSREHLALAREHGFTPEIAGAEVVIPDDTDKKNISEVAVNRGLIKRAKVARIFLEADALVGVAHFKGHIMTGFAGALKNIGMGCASREGKLAQHSDVSPVVVVGRCVGCGDCVNACLTGAISVRNNKAVIENSLCVGCASCIAACGRNAIELNWESGGATIQQKMAEYASAVLKAKKEKACFFNFAVKITKECDCLAKDDPSIAPDVGIFASRDPVSIDKACMDLVNKTSGRDIFKEAHPNRDGLKQLAHAATLGLGNLEYDLEEVLPPRL